MGWKWDFRMRCQVSMVARMSGRRAMPMRKKKSTLGVYVLAGGVLCAECRRGTYAVSSESNSTVE